MKTPDECPVCGAIVPSRARACPECGADEKTGWDEEATRYDGLDLPGEISAGDQDFSNENKRPRTDSNGLAWYWWVVGIFLIVVLLWQILARK